VVEFAKFGSARLSIISSPVQNFANGQRAIATAGNWDYVRKRHQNLTGKVVRDIRPLFTNYGPAGSGLNTVERASNNRIVVKNSTEFFGTPSDQARPRTPSWFGTSSTVTLDRGAIASPRPVRGTVFAGEYFYERTGVTVEANGHSYPAGGVIQGGSTGWGANTGEGVTLNSAGERVLDAASSEIGVTDYAGAYSAVAYLGYCVDGTVAPSVAMITDSIGAGIDDAGYAANAGGWVLRAFSNYPAVFLGFPGEQMANHLIRSNNYIRWEVAMACPRGVIRFRC
jgi:hypothetical protein